MNRDTFEEIRGELSGFAEFLFAGLVTSPTKRNLTNCLEARLVDARRKTHQPAGTVLARRPGDADGLRQRMNRATLGGWDDDEVRQRLCEVAAEAIPSPVAWVVDDTGVEKKGCKSPGVGRQYCGAAGKVTNCQLYVSTHLAGYNASLPLEMEVYLPKDWCTDSVRRAEAGIPEDVVFRGKPEIALEQIDRLIEAKVPRGVVLADAAYGNSGKFRQGLAERGLEYSVCIKRDTSVWRPGEGLDAVPPRRNGPGRPPSRQLPGKHNPVSVQELAAELPLKAYRRVRLWRGRHEATEMRVARLRVRTARGAVFGHAPGDEQWLLIEWPSGEPEPSHYYLSNLPHRARMQRLAEISKLRWRIERDYQDLKQEVGLSHYEGRRWYGLRHHLTICMAALTFLAIQRRLFPPEDSPVAGTRETTASI